MNPIRFSEMTQELAAPPGLENEVMPLPVRVDAEGIHSVWKLEPVEREQVARNGLVILTVMGKAMPPVSLRTAEGVHRLNAADDLLLVRQVRKASTA
jgi:hypothetical protein